MAAQGYGTAKLEGVFDAERYQGCSALLVQAIGGPWALYSATRIPGEDKPLRWLLYGHGCRWGSEFPGEPVPQPNAVVLSDGSLSLQGTSSSRQGG